jgi:tRNA threonylcarbamoyladenosine biosynthesis protein TsaB
MLTLAVDTAAEIGSIALADESHILGTARLDAPGGYGQILFGELEALLARCHTRLAEIDLYAAASGPGSFTGVRVGLAAIKGLAEVAGKPAVGISSLAALAQYGTTDLRAPVIDAKRGEIFAAVYDRDGAEIIPAAVITLQAFAELVGARKVEYVSTGFDPGCPVTIVPPELAGMIARLAIERRLSGESCDPAAIEANYVRRSDAEIFWKE